jgi:predicted short-subunit dehydrogenase-like oxidoreductase (DUF2520 family)
MAAPRVPLDVGIVGTGRVGAVLGAAFARAGHRVVGASGVSAQSRDRAERLLPGVPLLAADQVVVAADLVLIAVPDDVLRDLVAGLASTGAWTEGQIVAHTSGAHGIGVLDPAAARGVVALALHPAMTFTGRPEDLDRLVGAAFGITSAGEMRPVAEALVVELGGEPIWVPERARALYHAALTFGSNYLITLVNESIDRLDDAGVESSAQLLAPLLSAALDNALRLHDAALTGPISRGDVATVALHLDTLRADNPETAALYSALGRRTVQRAQAAGRITAAQAAALTERLEAP